MRKILFASLLLLSLSVLSSFGNAQSAASATIRGRVTDPQGAVITTANVTATNVETGVTRTSRTTNDGLYNLPNLQPGNYNVTVEAQGFSKMVNGGVHVNVGDIKDVNFALRLGAANTVVEVSGEAPLVESTKTDVSTVVNESDLATLPVTNAQGGAGGSGMNDFATLALTAPGVRLDQTTVSNDLVGPGQFNDRNNLINIDGGNIIDQVDSGRDGVGASVDEVQEFQVLTNNYNAEYGQAGGIIINAITKSGTNQLHGDFHFFARGRNMSASTYFYNLGIYADPAGQCPGNTDALGNLKSIDGCPRAPFFKHETGFTMGGPFKKDKTFWFVSYEKLLSGVPNQLTPPSGSISINQPDDEVLWSAKVDHELTTNNKLSIRFNVQRITQANELVQITNNASPDALVNSVIHDHTLNGSLTSTVTPHVVNEARMFWHRFFSLTPTNSTLPGQQGPNFYFHAAFCCPQGADQNRIQGLDNLSWTHGTHISKFGANFSYFPYFSIFQQFHYGLWSGFAAEGPGGTNPPTGLAGANPPTAFQFGAGKGTVRSKDNIYSWYAQDSWKIRPTLTLNYGLRWDYEAGAFHGGTISGPNGTCFQGNGIIPACSSDKNNFQPRLGLAWAPNFQSGPLRGLFGGTNQSVISASFAEVTELAFLNVVLDSLNFDGINLSSGAVAAGDPCWSAVAASFPNYPDPTALASCSGAGPLSFGRVRPISNHLHNPEVRDAALSWQRALGTNAVLNLQYVGAFGFGQFGERDANYPPILPDPSNPGYLYFGDRADPRFTAVRTNENSRTSSYNGLIVDINKRMAHHFQVHGGYVWSHTISSTEDFFGVSEPGDPRNINAEKADAQSDIRHAINLGAVIDTSKLTSIAGVRHFVNNWQFAIASQLQSGRPWPISTGDVAFANAAFFGIGNESVQRPNVLSDGTISTAGIADSFAGFGFGNFNIGPNAVAQCQAAGVPSCPTQNTFLAPSNPLSNCAPAVANVPCASPLGAADVITGDIVDFKQVNGNLRRNAGRGNSYYRTDFSVTRGFPIRERIRVELRADFFNVFNHPNFWLFNSAPNTTDMGIPTDAVGNVDFAAWQNCTGCLSTSGQYVGNNGQILKFSDLRRGRISRNLLTPTFNGLGDPGGTDLAREMQLSIRVRW